MTTTVSTIERMVELVSLRDVQCVEDRARRISWDPEAGTPQDLPQTDNSIGVSQTGSEVHYRLRIRYTDVGAEYVADWSAIVAVPEDTVVDPDVVREYGERVAFFTLFPFLRAAIYGAASRLNQPVPVLGFIRQGELEMGRPMSAEEAAEAFMVRPSDSVLDEDGATARPNAPTAR